MVVFFQRGEKGLGKDMALDFFLGEMDGELGDLFVFFSLILYLDELVGLVWFWTMAAMAFDWMLRKNVISKEHTHVVC